MTTAITPIKASVIELAFIMLFPTANNDADIVTTGQRINPQCLAFLHGKTDPTIIKKLDANNVHENISRTV